MSLVRTSALALCMMLAACVTAGPPKPEGVGGIFRDADNQQQGKISIQEAVFKKRSLNIEQERWLVKLDIRSDAFVTTECNIYLRVFDRDGAMLDEFLLFSDVLPYEETVKHSDFIYVKREYIDRVTRAEYAYHCLRKGVLE